MLKEEHNEDNLPTIPQLRRQYPELYRSSVSALLGVALQLQKQTGGLPLVAGDDEYNSRYIHSQLSKTMRTTRHDLNKTKSLSGGVALPHRDNNAHDAGRRQLLQQRASTQVCVLVSADYI